MSRLSVSDDDGLPELWRHRIEGARSSGVLDLSFLRLAADGAKMLAPTLRELNSLATLNLSNNELGPDGAEVLASALADLKQLATLNLSNNELGPDGAEVLAPALAKLRQLATLQVWSNNFGSDGADKLTSALKRLHQLAVLDLSYNELGPCGMEKLAPGLKDLKQLGTLDLRGNKLGPVGAEKLAPTLMELDQLATLNLSYNNLGPDGAEKLAPVLRKLRRLATLDLSYNRLLPPELEFNNSAVTLLAHLLSLGKRQLAEAKVVLLGDGQHGKTHLRQRLIAEPGSLREFFFRSIHTRTRDMETCEWPVQATLSADQGLQDVLLRVWDFGGQEHLHASHRFFLSDDRCIYVLVLDADKSPADNHARYWLNYIRHAAAEDRELCEKHLPSEEHRRRAGDTRGEPEGPAPPRRSPPVILAVTKCDKLGPGARVLDRHAASALAEQTGANIVGVVKGIGWGKFARQGVSDLKSGDDTARQHSRALADLRSAISESLSHVPGVAMRMPDAFFEVRDWLAAELQGSADRPPRAFIPFDEYEKRARQAAAAQRKRDPEKPVQPGFDEFVLEVCRSLGLVHYVGDRDASMKTIFNPAWVKGPIYALLWQHKHRYSKGVMQQEEIESRLPLQVKVNAIARSGRLWKRLRFTAEHRGMVLRLLHQCELIVLADPTNPTAGCFVPDLVNIRNNPEPESYWKTAVCLRFKFLPESHFLKFIGRWYHKGLMEDWQRNGYRDEVMVRDSSGVARLHVRLEKEESKLRLKRVTGESIAAERLIAQVLTDFPAPLPERDDTTMLKGLGERHLDIVRALVKLFLENQRTDAEVLASSGITGDQYQTIRARHAFLTALLPEAEVGEIKKSGKASVKSETYSSYRKELRAVLRNALSAPNDVAVVSTAVATRIGITGPEEQAAVQHALVMLAPRP